MKYEQLPKVLQEDIAAIIEAHERENSKAYDEGIHRLIARLQSKSIVVTEK